MTPDTARHAGPRGPRPSAVCACAERTVARSHPGHCRRCGRRRPGDAAGDDQPARRRARRPTSPRLGGCCDAGRARDRCDPARPRRPGPASTRRAGSATRAENAAFELEANQPVAVWMKQVRPDAGRAMHGQAHRRLRLHRLGRAHRGAGREPHRPQWPLTATSRRARAVARLGGTRRAVCARWQGHGRTAARRQPDALHLLAAQRRAGHGHLRSQRARRNCWRRSRSAAAASSRQEVADCRVQQICRLQIRVRL